MTRLIELTEQIAGHLSSAGFSKHADELLELYRTAVNEKISNNERIEALNQIEMRCHIRWLGDLYVPQLSLQDWWGRLEKLNKAARKYKKSLAAS
jgi:hypothetical protein